MNSRKIILRRRQLPELFLYAAIVLYFIYYFSVNSYLTDIAIFSSLLRIELNGSILLLIISICLKKRFKLRVLLLMTLLLIIGALITVNNDNFLSIFMLFIFMIAGLDANPEKLYEFTFFVDFIITAVIVLLAKAGMIQNVVKTALTHARRNCLGFTAPNVPIILFFCLLLYISGKKKEIKLWEYFLFLIGVVYLYIECDMNAPFFFGVAVIVLSFLARFIKDGFWDAKFIINLSYIVIPLCVVSSFIMPILYMKNVTWVHDLDLFVSGRIHLGATALQRYGITPFGQIIQFNYGLSGTYNTSKAYFYLDSSYLKYIFMYGFVIMGFILYGYHCAIKHSIRDKKIQLLLSLIASLLYFVWNPQLFYIPYNPFIITIFSYVINNQQVKRLRQIK